MGLESDHFYGSAGTRIALSSGALILENKFGFKEKHVQDVPVLFPTDKWVAVKIQLILDDTADGLIESGDAL